MQRDGSLVRDCSRLLLVRLRQRRSLHVLPRLVPGRRAKYTQSPGGGRVTSPTNLLHLSIAPAPPQPACSVLSACSACPLCLLICLLRLLLACYSPGGTSVIAHRSCPTPAGDPAAAAASAQPSAIDCCSAGTPPSPLLMRLLKGEGGAAEWQKSRRRRQGRRRPHGIGSTGFAPDETVILLHPLSL